MTKSLLPTTAREWNNKYPRGTKVRFYPNGRRNGAQSIETETKGAAYHNSAGTLFVPLKGFGEFGAGKPVGNIEIVPAIAPELVAYEAVLRNLRGTGTTLWTDWIEPTRWISEGPYEP